MSKYTTEVRYICETYAGHTESQDYTKVEDVIANSLNKVFDFDFPMFDESYRSVLETKILRHYYTREIGFETVGLWKHFLNMRLNEIMPYYNKLYASELLEFNPLYNVKYDISHQGSESGTSSDEIDSTELTTRNLSDAETRNMTDAETKNLTDTIEANTSVSTDDDTLDKYSDTPQGGLSGLLNDTYLTNARKIEKNTDTDTDYDETGRHTGTDTILRTGTDTFVRTGTNNLSIDNNKNSEFSNTDQYLRHVEGNNGAKSFSQLLMEFRESFLNIDMMIINELNDLFMGVW